MIRFWLAASVALLLSTATWTSRAHDPFEVTTTARVDEDALTLEVTMARSTALRLVTSRSEPRATFPPNAFPSYQDAIERSGSSFYEPRSAGRALGLRRASARLTDENDVEVVLTYETPAGPRLLLRASHLSVLPDGYTTAVSFVSGGPSSVSFKLLTSTDTVFDVPFAGAAASQNLPPVPEASARKRFEQFVLIGVVHVLGGWDHLLFLFGVLVACRTVRGMVAIVTSFTLAHSLTLALAALGHASVPARVVEPLIAASIVFVGLENVLRQEAPRRRIAITFVFGLVHGLGFAGVLTELELERSALPLTLVAFNLGVEIGQISVAAIVMPLVSKLHSIEHGSRWFRFSSLVVSLAGCFWFLQRVAGF